jgi:hypothetical protein
MKNIPDNPHNGLNPSDLTINSLACGRIVSARLFHVYVYLKPNIGDITVVRTYIKQQIILSLINCSPNVACNGFLLLYIDTQNSNNVIHVIIYCSFAHKVCCTVGQTLYYKVVLPNRENYLFMVQMILNR